MTDTAAAKPRPGSTAQKPVTTSVIIPSLNQAQYLAEAIESVLAQQQPGTEIIVIDGGSTDGTVDILKSYEAQLAYWVSESDEGQSDALNKGLAKANGEIWCYLNSDDRMAPGSLAHVKARFEAQPALDWLSGSATVFGDDIESWVLAPIAPTSLYAVLTPWLRTGQYLFPASVACFMRRRIYEDLGAFDKTLHYSMDMEYYTRALVAGYQQHITTKVLGHWRWHAQSKTAREGSAYGFRGDEIAIATRYLAQLSAPEQSQLKHELRAQQKWLVVQRAMFALASGDRAQALRQLVLPAINHPALLAFRPWLGALRQCLSLQGRSPGD